MDALRATFHLQFYCSSSSLPQKHSPYVHLYFLSFLLLLPACFAHLSPTKRFHSGCYHSDAFGKCFSLSWIKIVFQQIQCVFSENSLEVQPQLVPLISVNLLELSSYELDKITTAEQHQVLTCGKESAVTQQQVGGGWERPESR